MFKFKITKKTFRLITCTLITLIMSFSGLNINLSTDNERHILDISLAERAYADTFDPTVSIMPIQAGYYHDVSLQSDGTVKSWGYNYYGQLGFGDTAQRNAPTVIPGLTGVKQVAAALHQTFALMNDGTVKAWGYNGYGQLGFGDTTQRNVPTVIPGLTGVKQLVAGTNSTYALMNDGTVKAWGYNGYGELGLGNTSSYYTPTVIPGLTGVKQLAAGDYHTLALMNDGTVKSWGYNGNYQLGFGDTVQRNVPTVIPGLTGVKQLAAAYQSSFALMSDGTVKAWGYNGYGELGVGNTTTQTVPTVITTLTGVVQLSAGYYHCMALMSDGTVKAWGYNNNGQLGLGDTTLRNTPTVISTLTGVRQLTAGYDDSIALMGDGTVKVWGNNAYGQLGLNDVVSRNIPTILNLNTKPSIGVLNPGQNYTTTGYENNITPTISVLDINNDNLTCKYYLDSETNPRDTKSLTNTAAAQNVSFSSLNLRNLPLGVHTLTFNVFDGTDNTSITTNFTIADFDVTNIMPIQAGYYHDVLLQSDGTVKSWGYNGYGQLGFGDTAQRSVPTVIPGLTGVKQVAAAYYQTFALMNDGTVKAWGYNSNGQLGFGDTTQRNVPTVIPGLTGVKQLVAGTNSTYALMNDGTVKAWGCNGYGELGLGNISSYFTPTVIPGLTGVKQLAAGDYHTLALMNDGTVKSWGYNGYGQLGFGDTAQRNAPTVIPGLTGVKQVAATLHQTFALMNDGTVKSWGYNVYGQLGLGNTSTYYTPTAIPNLTGVVQLIAGYYHCMALMSNGTVKVWGYNNNGQLGLSDITTRNTPTVISALTGVRQLTAGYDDSIALMGDGTIKVWGNNAYGQLGLNDVTNRYIPAILSGMKINTKPRVVIPASEQNHICTSLEDIISPAVTVSDLDNDTLTCRYFIDSDSNAKQTKSVSNTITAQTIFFDPSSLGSMAKGTHTITFEISDGTDTITATTTIIINIASPVVVISNNTGRTLDLTMNDTYPNDIEYQITCGSKYIDSQGNLTSYPTWIKLNNKKITVLGLTDGVNYTFQAKARNYVGNETPLSDLVSTTTTALPLDFPSNVTASAESDSKIRITWDPVAGADSYIVECDGVQNSAGTNLWYDDINLEAGSSHKYRVCAVSGGVKGVWSEYVETTAKLLSPLIPQNITIVPAGTSISVTWNAVEGAIGYDIEIDGVVQLNGTKTSYKHTGLKPLTDHTYRVRAKNLGGAGAWSQLQTVMTTGGLPGSINNIKADISGSSITLNWDPAVDAETYNVVEVVNGVNSDPIDTVGGTTFEDSGLGYNSTHTYMIKAVNSIGDGAWSNPITVTTCGLDTPSKIKVSKTDTTLTLNWNSVNGANYYEVQAKTLDGTNNLQIVSDNSGIIATTYAISGLIPETQYIVNVKAIGGLGSSAWSKDMTTVTLPTKPEVPSNVNAMITEASVTIKWDAVGGALGYDVELDGIVLENDNVLNYVNDSLNLNEAHTYRVRARNSAIAGDWSTLQSINSLPGKPVAPSNIAVNSTQTGADISWDPVDAAVSYDLEINNGTNTYIVSNLTDTSYIHRRVGLNVECRYRIRTNNIEGTSDWSGYIINNAIKANCKKNNTVDLGLTATDVTDFSPYTMVVTYNPGAINVVDLCTITGQNDLSVGKIDGTDVTIKEFTPGRIVFVVDKVVTPGEAWTGIVNSIKFMAKANGGTTITYTVFVKPVE